jgi:hypothetical protein
VGGREGAGAELRGRARDDRMTKDRDRGLGEQTAPPVPAASAHSACLHRPAAAPAALEARSCPV